MKGQFLVPAHEPFIEVNVYADKSALVLEWLLTKGVEREQFSLRDIVKERGVSLGLVQRVFEVLVQKGFLQVEGVRTAKKFSIPKPNLLFNSWIEHS